MESVAKKLLLLIALVASGLSRLVAVFFMFLSKTCANYLPVSDESNHEKVYIILADWEIHASTL